MDQDRPKPPRIGPNLPQIGHNRPEFTPGANLDQNWPKPSKIGPNAPLEPGISWREIRGRIGPNPCCGQLWVWHMFCGVGLWWAIPPNKINGSYWNTVWVSVDRMDLCQTHCRQVLDISRASKSGQVTWSEWANSSRRTSWFQSIKSKQVPDFSRSSGSDQITWVDLSQHTWLSSSSYLRVNMGCALAIVFQVRSLYVPITAGYSLWSLFPGVPSL